MKTKTGVQITLIGIYVSILAFMLTVWGPHPAVFVYGAVLAMAFYVFYLAVLPELNKGTEMTNSYRFWIIQISVLCFLSGLALLSYHRSFQ